MQYAKQPDQTPVLNDKQKKFIQSIVGSLLYYARAVDPTMLVALNELSSQQANPHETTLAHTYKLLAYAATHPNAILRFHASDMVLHVDSDAAYLVLPEAKSRIAGHFYLSDHPNKLELNQPATPNAPILTECRTLRHVVASAAEAETGGLFHNARMSITIRHILHTLEHPQPPTPIKTDNATAQNVVTKKLKQKMSKS